MIAAILIASALSVAPAADEARVDAQGALRWVSDGSEVALLGVNYYAPFCLDYASIKEFGLDHKAVIDRDLADFARLGLRLIRIHTFDREFSTADGGLIDNHHVELLDYLIAEGAKRGIYTVLTPIAWFGDTRSGPTTGFSTYHMMTNLTADRVTWPIQARFLREFASHTNRYTKLRYADDPAVLAFECINEPVYPEGHAASNVTDYINTLYDGLRASGTQKPIYYNSWRGFASATGASKVEGISACCYPGGMLHKVTQTNSPLWMVAKTYMETNETTVTKSRMIYEFDAADTLASHLYPAMARLFRAQGAQIAAQFQYDPHDLAHQNYNWFTHWLNLDYTPNKAISLAIAAEAFKRLPRSCDFTREKLSATFDAFRVSETENLSEFVTETDFIYSNSTATEPPAPEKLTRIWGVGTSPVASWSGNGAYFLDRQRDGSWRLEIRPNVEIISEPFACNKKTKARLIEAEGEFRLTLPDKRLTKRLTPGVWTL